MNPSDPLLSRLSPALQAQGWTQVAHSFRQLHVSGPCLAGGESAPLCFFERDSEVLAIADFDATNRLAEPSESPTALFARFLDLSLRERLALWTLRQTSKCDWLICLTPEGCSLLGADHETALGRCEPDPDSNGVNSLIRALETRDAARRPVPDTQRLADDLACWSELFLGALGPALQWGSRRHGPPGPAAAPGVQMRSQPSLGWLGVARRHRLAAR